MDKASSKTGRFSGKRQVPRSATYKVGKAPLGQHHTASQKSKKSK